MAAKVDDMAEPRRCIPDHPPYSLMIGEAIRSLNEEEGSTESSISEYIKANFDGLPWGHHRLLPYYLKKLVAQGEFANGAMDRYLLADDDECHAKEEKIATAPPMNVKCWAKFARKKRSKKEVGTKPSKSVASTLIEPEIKGDDVDKDDGAPLEIKDGNFDGDGVPLACHRDLVIDVHYCKSDAFDDNSKVVADNNGETISSPKGMQSSVGESAIASKLIASICDDIQNSKVLSRRKQPILPDEYEEDCVLAQSNSVKNSKLDALGSESLAMHKCPEIKDAEPMKLVDSSSLGNNDNVIESENIEDRVATKMAQNQEDDSKQGPKKPRQPRKRKHQPLEDSSQDSIAHVEDVHTLELVDASSLCDNDDNAIEPQVIEDNVATRAARNQEDGSKHVPKKHGRPQKQKDQSMEDSSKESIHVGDVDALQSVDPSSFQVTEDLGVPRMAQNQEDGLKQALKKLEQPRKRQHEALRESSEEVIVQVEGVDTLPLVKPFSSCTNEDARNRDEESRSTLKRRGRPPKKNSDDIEMVQATNMDEMTNPTETQKKKLGRPPKSKKSSSQNGDQIDMLEYDHTCNVELQEGKKESDPMPKHHEKPNKNSSKESIHVGDVDALQSVDPSSFQVTEDLGVPRMAQNQEDGSKQAPKKLERLRKREHEALRDSSEEATVQAEGVDTLPLVKPFSSCTNEDARNRDDESRSVLKRCGRPPKMNSDDIEMVQATNMDEMTNPTETQKKKLGRPPKSKKSSSQNGDQIDMLEYDHTCNVELQEGKKESDPMPKHHEKPNKNSSKESIHVGDVDALQSVDPSSFQVTEDLGVPRMAQNQEDGSKQAPKKLERLRKREHEALRDSSEEATVQAEGVDTLPLVKPFSSCTNEDARNRDDESRSVLKRCGRPPKMNSDDIEMVQATNMDEMTNPTETQKKKLGRPPKSKKSSSQNGDQVDMLDHTCNAELQEGKKESDPMPRHHEKPNKIKVGFVARNNEWILATEAPRKSEEKNSSRVPKRRGRPPKPKLDLKVDVP